MQLAFLGSGAAFSLERYNGAVVVDGRLLLDGGAPLLPHMHRLGLDPGAIEALFLTHYHGDHLLGLPPFILHRVFVSDTALEVVGPPGVEDRLETLFRFCWGAEWDSDFRKRVDLTYREAGPSGDAAGVRYETEVLDHGPTRVTGYRLHLGDRVLVYAGDTEMTPALERLVEGADVVITEATGPGSVFSHTSWEQAAALASRHPRCRFLFNHLYSGVTDGAVADFEVVDVP